MVRGMPDDELLKGWGARVRRARTELGWTQSDLADRAKTSKAHVSNIEVGRTSVSDDLRMRLAAALNTTVAELFPYPDQAPAA